MRRLHLLIAVLGRRAGLTFGVVTLLVSALLATVDITSRHALKVYVEDQLQRIPWDVAVYQRSAGSDVGTIQQRLQAVDGLERVESLAFLRARFPDLQTVSFDVGGKPLTTPWLSLLAATDPSILPTAELRQPGAGAVLALVGPERAMGSAFLALQGARDFKLRVNVNGQQRVIFETPLRAVVRLDRDELNRWVMDQTGSVTYIPYVGVILMMPFDAQVITRFDSVASGILPPEVVELEELEEGHIPLAEYEPEVVFLGRIDRQRLISGWDIPQSLARVADLTKRAGQVDASAAFVVDSTTHVLLQRMEGIARLVGVVTVLVSLPLLWMGWVLAANLCALLMLNERRKLGLLRLRGVPGQLMGRAFLLSIVFGGLVGGVLGLVVGSIGPLLAYEGGGAPFDVLLNAQQLMFAAGFLVVSVVLALAVSRRLIRYATTISPLEASRRVSQSESGTSALRFGPVQAMALVLGLYTLVLCWILGRPLSQTINWTPVRDVDRLLNFVGLPLLLYGVATLLASKQAATQWMLDLLVRPIGGALGHFAVRHLSVKPHRTAAFLLIVALMASVTLYPTITSRSFSDKAERGARVQLGGDLQLLFNSPDLADVGGLRGSLEEQLRALTPAVDALVARVKQADGVADATYLYEAVLPQFYLPGYGLKGVPLFLVGEPDRYMQLAYSESVIGLSDTFANVMRPLPDGQIAASPPVADFWKLEPGLPLLVGMDRNRAPVDAIASGVLAYLPGIPPRSVTDRQGYVQARIDYLNHLFNSNAYLVSAASNSAAAAAGTADPSSHRAGVEHRGRRDRRRNSRRSCRRSPSSRSRCTTCPPRSPRSAPTCSSRSRSRISAFTCSADCCSR